ncbi:low affinity iron permease family protein [Pseudonocardia sp. TRM90224]|uniref:low affinity iron permease family protein n=1 Tax=Pseudonocardia sp. TRM90224 TaxID=2812678 RepID=UPI001E4C8F0A|nr:low affinity iron permease family protein [Pseudonocardia sp. TRM90224]
MTMPEEGEQRPNVFDRFADAVDRFTSKAWFFAACVLVVLLWAPSFVIFPTIDTWQLIINTTTTIVTFLLVALQQNAQKRSNDAVQEKLNALAAFLLNDTKSTRGELRAAVGLEDRESSS